MRENSGNGNNNSLDPTIEEHRKDKGPAQSGAGMEDGPPAITLRDESDEAADAERVRSSLGSNEPTADNDR